MASLASCILWTIWMGWLSQRAGCSQMRHCVGRWVRRPGRLPNASFATTRLSRFTSNITRKCSRPHPDPTLALLVELGRQPPSGRSQVRATLPVCGYIMSRSHMDKHLPRLALLVSLGVITSLVSSLRLGTENRARAQMRVAPLDDQRGHVALGLALRHLANTGTFMMATAHPDDENNGLLVLLNRGLGYRTALATATRGNGGQNEIGPELFEALGVLRTGELGALHRFDGAEQYFTRAVDFGYSIDIPETLEKWGRDEIIGDYVRLIRTVRPDVISAQSPTATGPGQHAHHATAAILSHDAYKLA